MLIRFAVENYRSFNERQIFSMVAGKHTRHKDHLIVMNGKRLLKGGVLFGANAAGKSNLIKAINFFKNIVMDGVKPSKTVDRNFRIVDNSIDRPGVFQCDFATNSKIYSYGVAISYRKNIILSEWLYSYTDNKEKCIFDRIKDGKITTNLDFKDEENKQRFKIYSDDVPDNKTLLSEIVNHKLQNSVDFMPFFDAFKWFESLIIIFPQTKFGDYEQLFMNDTLDSLGPLLNYFDTGIKKVIGEEKTIDDALFFLPEKIKNRVIHDVEEGFDQCRGNDKPVSVEISLAGKRISFSKNIDGKIIASQLVMDHGNENELFELKDESDGTRRLFDLIPLFKRGENNYIIFVDELDRSFHTKLTIEFINKFYEKTAECASQLIFTTHDSNVMNLNILRQDEIWFIERQEDQSSKLYSLNKFKARFDHSVAKDYLLGRYGSIPNFGVDTSNKEEL